MSSAKRSKSDSGDSDVGTNLPLQHNKWSQAVFDKMKKTTKKMFLLKNMELFHAHGNTWK